MNNLDDPFFSPNHISASQTMKPVQPLGNNKLLLGDGTTLDGSNLQAYIGSYKQMVIDNTPAYQAPTTPINYPSPSSVDPLASRGSVSTNTPYSQTDRFGNTWSYYDDNSNSVGGGGTVYLNGKPTKTRYRGYSVGSDGTREYNTLSYPTIGGIS